jgi:hypothetical protein
VGLQRGYSSGAASKSRVAQSVSIQPGAQRLDRGMAGAGIAGISDSFTFGGGDYLTAALSAARGSTDFSDWRRRFQIEKSLEKARDEYDRAHHPRARLAGQVAGTGAQFLALGPLDGALAGGVGLAKLAGVGRGYRLARTTAMKAHELGAIGAAGAGAGVGGQVVSDIRSGRPGSPGDYAAAGTGGLVDAVASPWVGPGKASALGGATTSALQDVFNGRPVSYEDAARSAAVAGGIGGVAGLGARGRTARLSPNAKGRVGERLSRVRTIANADYQLAGRDRLLPSGALTKTDGETLRDITIESKLGRWAKLSRAQKEAMRVLGPKYRLDHFTPLDLGLFAGVPAGLFGHGLIRDDRR